MTNPSGHKFILKPVYEQDLEADDFFDSAGLPMSDVVLLEGTYLNEEVMLEVVNEDSHTPRDKMFIICQKTLRLRTIRLVDRRTDEASIARQPEYSRLIKDEIDYQKELSRLTGLLPHYRLYRSIHTLQAPVFGPRALERQQQILTEISDLMKKYNK